jgi:hypothetical protein
MTVFREGGAPLRNIGKGVNRKGRSVTERRRGAALKTASLH